jgi:4-amino-4-deoxy-L-arabinose transferase-like glycosyltransferase
VSEQSVVELTHTVTRDKTESSLIVIVGIFVLLTLVRLAGLATSNVDLFTDEAQYWSWSRELSWGYFSKPPLIAWVIHVAESVCGSSEACVRAPSPIFYFGTCVLIYLIGRKLYGPVVGLWAALLMMFGIALEFSSRIISTDVPLLFFWALALWAYVNLLERASWPWAVTLGASIGLGLLTKYAMGYFVLGMVIVAVFDRSERDLLRNRLIWLAFGIALAIAAPNLIWVLHHDFVTFRNVAAVVQTDSGPRLHPLAALEFLAAQFAVFGPVVFGAFLLAIARIRSWEGVAANWIMLSFALPPLVIITLVALFSRAYANWAATGAISATILAAAVLVQARAWRWLTLSIVLGLLVQAALLVGDAAAYRVAIPFLPSGKSDVYQRTLGFRALSNEASQFVEATGAPTIAGEDRKTVAALLYYMREQPLQILASPSPDVPTFDMTRPLTKEARQPIVFLTECASAKRLAVHYANVEKIGEIHPPTGPTSSRNYTVFRLSGPKGEFTATPD